MRAAIAETFSSEDPIAGMTVRDAEPAELLPGWVRVQVRAATLNHHDIWSLRGVGLSEDQLPMILGCDAAGVTEDGREVLVHAVVSDPDFDGEDETFDPGRTLLSELHPGTLAEYVDVPARNLVDKSPELSFAQAACLPTAYLTAYRMLFTRAQLKPGETLLVQGASGGVATALIVLARAAGARVFVTSRTTAKGEQALTCGAHEVFETGSRLPTRVDVVADTVGEAVWEHSLKCLRPGGRLVTAGATSGAMPPAMLQRIFFLQLSIIGSTMGTVGELRRVQKFMTATDVRPIIDSTYSLQECAAALQRMIDGKGFGKIVIEP